MNNQDYSKHLKASKLAIVLTLAGFIIISILIDYNSMQLTNFESSVSQKEQNIVDLQNEIKSLHFTIDTLLNAAETTPNVSYEKLNVSGTLYDFSIWIDIGAFHKKDIKQVAYSSAHRALQEMTSTESSNGFAISVRSPECLTEINISIVYLDGSVESFTFDMCETLGW